MKKVSPTQTRVVMQGQATTTVPSAPPATPVQPMVEVNGPLKFEEEVQMPTPTPVKLPILVSTDIGFGVTKRISSAFPVAASMPSSVYPGVPRAANRALAHQGIDENNLVVTTEEGSFFVGEHALNMPTPGSTRTLVKDRANDHASRVLFQTSIGLSVPHEDGEYEVFVVTGLPNEDYDLSYKRNLEQFLNRDFSITFHLGNGHSIVKHIKVIGVEVLRQPEGSVTFNQFVFDPAEFLVPSMTARSLVGVIDLGHFTTDFALFKDGVIIEDSTVNNSTIGVTEMYNKLKKRITLKFDEMGYEYRPTDKDLDTAVQTGFISYVNQEIDVRPEIEESAREVAAIIAKAVLDAWGNHTNRLELILITGGGSNIFAPYLQEEFNTRRKQGFLQMEMPQFTNALGYYMYGCIALADKFDLETIFQNYIDAVFVRAA